MRPTQQERSEDRARSTPQKAPDAGASVSQAPALHTLTRASRDTLTLPPLAIHPDKSDKMPHMVTAGKSLAKRCQAEGSGVVAADCMPRTKTVPLTPLSLRPGSQGTGLGMGLNCQPFQPAGCLHVLRDDFPKVDSLALGQKPRMDVTGTQGASSNLALQQESMSKFVCTDTCVYLWAKVASSAAWKILGTQKVQRPYASVPRADQSSAQQTSGLPVSIVYPSGPAAESSASWISPKEELRLRRKEEPHSLEDSSTNCQAHPHAAGLGSGTSQRQRHHRHRLPRLPHRTPRISTAPDSLPPKSALEAEGQQPPARSRLQYRVSVSMGVTGANGFPCCGKESVDIMDSQGDINRNQIQPIQEEDDMELEDELLGPELPEEELPQVEPEQKPFPQAEPKAKQEDPKPQGYREESPQPYGDALTKPDIRQLSMRSNSSYVSSMDEDYRSIHVQTSRHLFWVDRLIQVSEHSLQPVISTQPIQKSTEKTTRCPAQQTVPKDTESSKKQSQDPSTQRGPLDKASQKTPSPEPSLCTPSMGLEELINFASTLAMASSSRIDLPSLQHMIKSAPQKATPPPTEPALGHAAQPTTDEPEQGKLTKDEKPPEEPGEARKTQDAPKQEDEDVPHPYVDLRKPGFKRATIEGELKFLQSPTTSPQPKGAAKDSVPGTMKGNPLFLKIHFKLSTPASPEK
ncbi:spermatogenesis-associated protein 32 [Capricornis sumatraensis]|uniref:spermatogenesis-associated protein 32 n=1 Tax=Capricornis sumatraensis TaxID=34865 RepID=UPI0036046706